MNSGHSAYDGATIMVEALQGSVRSVSDITKLRTYTGCDYQWLLLCAQLRAADNATENISP